MKTSSRSIALLSFFALAFSLFACSGSHGGSYPSAMKFAGDDVPRPYTPAPSPLHMIKESGGAMERSTDEGISSDNEAETGEQYVDHGVNPWTDTAQDALSTFAIDVDTGAYSISRRKLLEGSLPPASSVRVEEFVNYFDYGYSEPEGDVPFAIHIEAAPSPVQENTHILRVGLQGKTISHEERKAANLVFLVDVSGSMNSPDKLGLAKKALIFLTEQLREDDTVSLVTYAGSIRLVLPPTPVSRRGDIIAALDALTSGGSTAMSSGLQLAYEQAIAAKTPGEISRVIVISDGDANVGRTQHGDMLSSIRHYVNEGVTLSTIGVGMGNYKDHQMEQLANNGNGNYYYFDDIIQAERVFGEALQGTLQVIAKDVKIQMNWNPEVVQRYRLLGYENRDVADENFRNDKVDGGEIGAGHRVTALFEVVLNEEISGPIGSVHVRYKTPEAKLEDSAFETVTKMDRGLVISEFNDTSRGFRFAVAVAGFAEILRESPAAKLWTLENVHDIAAESHNGSDEHNELMVLIRRAQELGKE